MSRPDIKNPHLDTLRAMPSLTQPWATLIAGAAVLMSAIIAASVAAYSRRQTEKHFQASHSLGVMGAFRDRYTTAAEQLAHESAAIRLAGVYALAALADDWAQNGNENESQVCVDLLRAYLRTAQSGSAERRTSTAGEPDPTIDEGELEVRKTIVMTINGRRILASSDPRSWVSLDCSLARADLRNLNLGQQDFKGVTLKGANLSSAKLADSDLTNADLSGADLTGAFLLGAILYRADLSFARLNNATLISANLNSAEMDFATLRGAHLGAPT
ncbi:pentapeptide repeat-containing protein [Prescottella defluvii]|nr:pentapeptide repeat-containing protein [Prescottella defluvii]